MPACVTSMHLTTSQRCSRHAQLHRSTTGTLYTSASAPMPAAGAAAWAWCSSSGPLHGHFPPRDHWQQSLPRTAVLACMLNELKLSAIQESPSVLASMEKHLQAPLLAGDAIGRRERPACGSRPLMVKQCATSKSSLCSLTSQRGSQSKLENVEHARGAHRRAR
jgi:hypothetical protein